MYTLEQWRGADAVGRAAMLDAIAERVAGRFKVDRATAGDLAPALVDAKHRVRYRLIFAHSFKFGFDAQDEALAAAITTPMQLNIEEMRPASRETTASFAITEEPVRNSLAVALLGIEDEEDAADIAGDLDPELMPSAPCYLGRESAEFVANALGGKLPTERQWEAMSRATSDTLFPFGNAVPSDDELNAWMEFDLDAPSIKRNSFSICGLFFGEWCRDAYRTSHAAKAPTVEGSFVIKGGGAFFWPWQGEEWVWCLHAMRMPSVGLDEDPDNRMAACRVVIEDIF